MMFKVKINGINENSWHRWGLKMNPFPQIASAELASHMMAINRLNGDPIKSIDEIETILKGFSQEFIDLCKARYVPGERVEFEVVWDATKEFESVWRGDADVGKTSD